MSLLMKSRAKVEFVLLLPRISDRSASSIGFIFICVLWRSGVHFCCPAVVVVAKVDTKTGKDFFGRDRGASDAPSKQKKKKKHKSKDRKVWHALPLSLCRIEIDSCLFPLLPLSIAALLDNPTPANLCGGQGPLCRTCFQHFSGCFCVWCFSVYS